MALGSSTKAECKNSIAIGSVAIGAGTTNDEENTVAMGNHRVTQVADGIRDNDAVNVKQLNDALANVDTTPSQEFITNVNNQFEQEAAARKTADDAEAQAREAGDTALQANIDDEAAKRIAGDAAEAQARSNADIALGQRIDTQTAIRVAEVSRLDGRIDQASRRLDDIEKNAYRGVAIALAAQQAVPNIRPGQIAVFAGVGHYEGETAGSVGIATSFISNRISLSGAVVFAGGNEVGSRIGLTYLW